MKERYTAINGNASHYVILVKLDREQLKGPEKVNNLTGNHENQQGMWNMSKAEKESIERIEIAQTQGSKSSEKKGWPT